MRITFGQYNQPYYEYGSQQSKNPNYKKPEKKHTVKNIGLALLAGGCIGFAFLQKKRY